MIAQTVTILAFALPFNPANAVGQEQMERQMTQRFSISALAFMGMSSFAVAHPDQPNALFHMLTEPDHLAMLSLVVVAGVFAIRKFRATR